MTRKPLRTVPEVEEHPKVQDVRRALESKGWEVHYTWTQEVVLDDDPERRVETATITQERHHLDLPYAVAAELVRLLTARRSHWISNVRLVRA